MNERFAHAALAARIDLAHEPDFTVGRVEVRPSLRELACEGRREVIDRRVMQVLVALARARSGVVSRDDLIESCWDGVVVGEDAINNCISRLRKAAEASGNVFAIETIPRVGYRLRISEIVGGQPLAASAAPQRPIYRGLQSLDEQDAGVFFGRDAPIAQGLEALRRMRGGSARSMFVILGASGVGKSSFLKAGLVARLKQDAENFLVLPVIRPERAALTGARGMAASLLGDPAGLNGRPDFARLFATLRDPIIARAPRNGASADPDDARPPTIVIPIDQAEELFAVENTEAARVFEFLAEAVRADRDTIILATIRSNAFEKLQNEPTLADVRLVPFSLARLPPGALKEVIEGPARLAKPKLAIEPALTDQLLRDLASDDALPLLAFTLERLWLRHRGGGTLTLAEYTDDLGGLQGAIRSAVDAAFADAERDPALPHERIELEQLTRTALIPALVHLDEADGEPNCRVERLNVMAEATLPLVRHLVDHRLLVSDRNIIEGIATDTIEVAHEAILRQWPALRSWIAEERDALRVLHGVRDAAREWREHYSSADHGGSWLAHGGGRLEEVEQLLAPIHFASSLQPFERDYLLACRARDDAEREREKDQIRREKETITRKRRLAERFAAGMLALVLLALSAVWVAYQRSSEAILARDETLQAQTRLLTKYAADRLKDGDSLAAERIIVEVLDGRKISQADRAIAVSVFQEARANDRQLAQFSHQGHVLNAGWSPDGTRVVTSSDNIAEIWDAATGARLLVLTGHRGLVEYAAFSSDGRRIATASDDKTARIWDAMTGKQLSVLSGHEGAVYSAAFSPDGKRIVTASDDKTARIWDAATNKQIGVLRGHNGLVSIAAFSPDGHRIVTASVDKTARIWDAGNGTLLHILSGHTDVLSFAAYDADGRRIVTASNDKTFRIWDATTGAPLSMISTDDTYINSAMFSPDGHRIITASAHNVRIWDAFSGKQLSLMSGHGSMVFSAAFAPDGRHIVSASEDKTARIWDMTNDAKFVLAGHTDTIHRAEFSPDGRRVATASLDHTARIWDATTGTLLRVLSGHDNAVNWVTFSPDGRRIVTASADNTARIWDVATGEQLHLLSAHVSAVNSAVFSSDGRRILTASFDKTARLWDAATGLQLKVLSGHSGGLWSAVFSPDGKRVATASDDKTVGIWDAATGKRIAVFAGHTADVYDVSFSPDGRRVVTASLDETARIWDWTTGAQIAVLLSGNQHEFDTAGFSPDGQRIVTASTDKTARIWDAATGMQLAVLSGHDGPVVSAAFSPDARRIITGSLDKSARIWDATIPADLNRQIVWDRAAEFEPLTQTERSQLGVGQDFRVRVWHDEVSKCDAAAAAPYDPDRQAPGVVSDQIAPEIAISACAKAAAILGSSPRFKYQLGRALLAKSDFRGAVQKFEEAVIAGYRTGNVDLADVLVNPSAKMLDPARAVSAYGQAWKEGVLIAAFRLGQLYEHGLSGKDSPDPMLRSNSIRAWEWYRKGADTEEPNALARFAERDDKDATAAPDLKKRDAILLKAFEHYAAAAERAHDDAWPDEAWKNWRYRRATLARVLAREGMMQQVADTYSAVRQPLPAHRRTFLKRIRDWLR